MKTIVLNTVNKSLEVFLTGAVATTQPKYIITFADVDDSVTPPTFVEASLDGALNGTTPVSILPAPGANVRRVLTDILIFNDDSAAVEINFGLNNTGTVRPAWKETLSVDETWVFSTAGIPVGTGGAGLSDGDYGDVTVGGSGTTMTIDNGAVSLAKMANLAANSIIGNNTGAGATPIALTASQVRTLLSLVIGTNAQAWSAVLDTLAGASANGQSLITAANYAAMKALLDLEIGVDVQAYDADLSTWAGLTPSANAQSLVTAADYAAMRTLLGLVIGTNVQAYDAELAALAGLVSAANKLPYFTGSGTASLADLSAAGRAIIDDADASAQRTTMGVAIGSDVQAYHAKLADLAGITYAQGDILYFNGTNIVKLAAGTSGDYLKTQGAGANPIWAAIAGGGDALVANPLSQFAATTSLQLKGVISDETGSGALVFANTPSLITPKFEDTSADHQYLLGVSELTANRIITLPLLTANDVFVFADFSQTLTGKRITKRSGSAASSATPTINTDLYDFYHLTAQAADITNFSTNLTGTPGVGDKLHIAITPTATRRIVWGGSFASGSFPLPQFARGTARLDLDFVWDDSASKWRLMHGPSTIDLILAAAVSTGANTTPVDLTDMYFDYEANSFYVFDVYVNAQAPATTTGLSIQANLSTTFDNYGLTVQHAISGSGDSIASSVADDTSVALTSGFPSTNTPVPVIGNGHLATNGNAGTCQFRLRSETTAVVTVDAGGIIVVRKIR